MSDILYLTSAIVETLENFESSRSATESVTLSTQLLIAKFRVTVLELKQENAVLLQEKRALEEELKIALNMDKWEVDGDTDPIAYVSNEPCPKA
jgi:hypothetical protein